MTKFKPRREPKFLELLDQLTTDHHGVVDTDDGPRIAQTAGLLQQLRVAVFSGMEGTGGSSAFGSKPPIDAAAVDRYEEIADEAAQALALVDPRPTPAGHPEAYIRRWAALVDEDTKVEVRRRATVPEEKRRKGAPTVFMERVECTAKELLRSWVESIEDYLYPPSSREINAPCPVCGIRYIIRMRDGENVRSAALNIHRDRRTGSVTDARCGNCMASWPLSQFPFLARLIGADIPEDLEPFAAPVHEMEISGGQLRFFCTAAADAPCRMWADCDCARDEDHDRRHPPVQHDVCILSTWFSDLPPVDVFELAAAGFDASTDHPRAPIEVEWVEGSPYWAFSDDNNNGGTE